MHNEGATSGSRNNLPFIFEGGMGLLIMQRHPDIVHPDLAAINHPQTVLSLHREYIDAGADTLKTLTFNANPLVCKQWQELCHLGVEQCRQAGAKIIAGDIGCVLPPNSDSKQAHDTYRYQAAELIDAGADILLVETLYHQDNGIECLKGCSDAIAESSKDIPLYINAVYPQIDASALADMVREFRCAGAGWNCCPLDSALIDQVEKFRNICDGVKILLQPSGNPDPAEMLATCISERVIDLAGGCCGTTPDTISRLSHSIK